MAAPDTETQAPPDYSGASPDLLAALKNLGGGGAPLDYGSLAQQLLQQPTLPQPDTTPVTRGLLSRLGEALGGGQVSGVMSPAQSETAGLRSLRDFGTSLIAGSGYYPGKPALGAFAEGFQGAERSQRGSEQQAAATLAAQQQYSAGQQEQYLQRLKMALPLLQMEAGSNIPNALLSANTPAVPGTAGGAGKPGGGGIALGMRQNNPLNLTFAGQPGAQPGQGNRFATFSDLPSGVAATADQLALYQTQHGINTVQDAVKRWVSDPKADLTSYTADVANALGVKPTDKIDLTDPAVQQKFILAAQPHESGGGGATLNPADVAKGVQLAAANRGQTVQGPQAPYKVATAGATVPGPPSGSTTAPAATPSPPGQTPPAASTAPPAPPTFADFQAQNPIQITPAEQATMDSLEQAKKQAAIELQRAPQTGVDRVKALEAYTTAANNVTTAQRQIQKDHTDQQAKLFTESNSLQQQAKLKADELAQAAKLKADELAQTAAEAERQRQAAERIENIKAGNTYHQQLDKESAEYAQTNTIKPMAAQATKAHQMNLGLSQLLPVLQDLPKGGGALGAVLDAHPDLAPLFNTAGILTDRSADAVRLVNGLVSNISTEMKPAGLGALREYEWDAFKAQLPSLLSTPAGQQKAVAMLMNMNDRIAQEHSWMNNYFNRKIPDDMSAKPGAMRSAHNLDTDGAESAQQRMDKELGPIIPSFTGQLSGANQAQWEQSLPPGKPYYKVWAVPDPKNPGQPRRDANGNVMTTKTLEVRPWQEETTSRYGPLML